MRQRANYYYKGKTSFNPRICKRCDKDGEIQGDEVKGFNPRICKRCDVTFPVVFTVVGVSIHASVKDATNYQSNEYDNYRFQSTHL